MLAKIRAQLARKMREVAQEPVVTAPSGAALHDASSVSLKWRVMLLAMSMVAMVVVLMSVAVYVVVSKALYGDIDNQLHSRAQLLIESGSLAVDPGNCGKCGVSCVIPHASPACSGNACAPRRKSSISRTAPPISRDSAARSPATRLSRIQSPPSDSAPAPARIHGPAPGPRDGARSATGEIPAALRLELRPEIAGRGGRWRDGAGQVRCECRDQGIDSDRGWRRGRRWR